MTIICGLVGFGQAWQLRQAETDELEKMKTVDYKGIDYGFGRTNISKSGIRYGVIPQDAVLQAWADSSEPDYGEPTCPKCGNKVNPARHNKDYHCPHCHENYWSDSVFGDPLGFELMDGEYSAHCGEDGDIFILDSPYFTYAQFCSPCAPGACYLLNALEDRDENNRAFCFGHDWFEDGRAPYPVYSVKTGELVLPEVKHETQRRD